MRRKKILLALLSLVVLLAVLVALAPTLASGYARSRIEDELAARVDGTVAVRSVSLSWFGVQRVEGLAIDGGPEKGRLDLDIVVAEGLLALAQGDDITIELGGRAGTAFDAEGRIGLAGLARPSDAADGGAAPVAPAADAPAGGTPLGARTLRILLKDLDLAATDHEGRSYAVNAIDGELSLVGNALEISLSAETEASAQKGALSIEAALALAFGASGADPAETTGTAVVSATRLAVPTGAGELLVSTLRLDVAKSTTGDVSVKADIAARVAGSSEATVKADVALASPFDAEGRFVLDPAAISAMVEARGVPLGALQPWAPEIAPGTRLSFIDDIGDTADLTLFKQKGTRARVAFAARQLRLDFDGAVAPDGSSIDAGTVTASATLRPELLAAVAVDTAMPLSITLTGERIAWRRELDAVRSVGGSLALALAAPFDCAMRGDPLRLRLDGLDFTCSKEQGTALASASVGLKGRYGATGDTAASLRGEIDLASRALVEGAADASLALDPAFLERVTGGALTARGQAAALRVSVPEIAYLPSEDYQGLQALVARTRIQLEGAVAIEDEGKSAAVRDLVVDLETPRSGREGSLAVTTRIDGALVRIDQRFAAIPAGAFDLSLLGAHGTVAIEGLDPTVIARLAPEASRSVGLLGRGAMRLDARNRTERGAVLADFTLDASAVDASGAMRYEPDAISASNLVVDATLTEEGLASLELGDATEIEPGARISLRAPMIALSRRGESAAWAPSGDVAVRAVVEGFRVLRAPGITAPIGVPKLDASASYVFAEERATINGNASLGGGGTAGALEFALAWRKPAEAKLFAGTEGTLALSDFDLARFEPSFGLEAGTYSGLLGGRGALTIEFSERDMPRGTVSLEFPRTNGAITLSAPQEGAARVARLTGRVSSDIAPDTLARLAGIGRDAARRVAESVAVTLDIEQLSAPLDARMQPDLAKASAIVRGSATPITIEVRDAEGRKSSFSTGALVLNATSAALAEEISLKVNGGDGGDAGTLAVDARVRGAIGADAKPTLDGTLRATKFPAATIDALAATDGAIARYLGDAIDAEADARGFSALGGTLAARLSSPYATLDAPALVVADESLTVASDRPVLATFTMSPAVREQLLASIHPVFRDVSTGAPARFTMPRLSWPLDGDRSKFDAEFSLETGEMTLVNSGAVSGLLALASAARTEGFEAFLDPLRAKVEKGRLTYSDFSLRVGKTAAGGWRNSVVFAGDIDLAAKPIRANSITTKLPLADVANWSREARDILNALSVASPELARSLTVGVEMSGPLFDAAGKPVKPATKLSLPDVGDVLKDNPAGILDAAGGIADLFRKKKKE